MSITRETVLALHALEREATAGEWIANCFMIVAPKAGYSMYGGEQVAHLGIHSGQLTGEQREKNAAFIAAAKTQLPALIATWLSMADRIERVEALAETMESMDKFGNESYWAGHLRAALAGDAKPEEQG